MTTKSPEEIRKDFVERSNKAKTESYKAHVINSLSEADRAAVETLAKLDDISGGNLPKLYQAYMFIKQSS